MPSLPQLHLHVISTDFDSSWMKTKKHYNSFHHPKFFMDIDDVIDKLEKNGCLEYSNEDMKQALKADIGFKEYKANKKLV